MVDRSVGNVLSGLFAPLVKYARDAGSAARKGSLAGIEKLFEQVPRAIAYGVAAYGLATSLPAEFGWIKAVVEFLKKALT